MIWILEMWLPETRRWKEVSRSEDFNLLFRKVTQMQDVGAKVRVRKEVVNGTTERGIN